MMPELFRVCFQNRRKENWGPTKAIIDELFDIATQLKVLDKKS
jgi:hypothetical protein